jgi:putative ABC transport system permease protein
MRIFDLLRSVRFVIEGRFRALLTLLGIVIGTGSIVFLASVLRGGEEALIRASQEVVEADIIQVRRDEVSIRDRNRTRRELSRDDARSLAASPVFGGALSESAQVTEAHVNGKKKRVRLVSAAPEAAVLYRLEVAQGRFLDSSDLDDRRRVCVVGHEVWKELFGSRVALDPAAPGPRLMAGGHPWTVIGVLADRPMLVTTDSTDMWNRKVLVPETTYDALYAPSHEVNRLYIRRNPGDIRTPLAVLRATIESTLLQRHLGVKNFVVGDDNGASQERLIISVIKMLLLSTGFIALLVGGINIMNIMLVTVTERTKEIGIRRAVGASRRAILAQFLIEAATVSLLGGVLGVLSGLAFSWLTITVLSELVAPWAFHLEIGSIALGLCLSVVTGLVFGFYPAWRAAHLNPIDALRAE